MQLSGVTMVTKHQIFYRFITKYKGLRTYGDAQNEILQTRPQNHVLSPNLKLTVRVWGMHFTYFTVHPVAICNKIIHWLIIGCDYQSENGSHRNVEFERVWLESLKVL